MIAIDISGQIKVFSSIPKTWNNTLNYHLADNQLHYDDGFRQVVQPTILPTQKKGAIYFDAVNDNFTYTVIDKTEAEIQNEALSISESNKDAVIQERLIQQELDKVLVITDVQEQLDNTDLYPFWEVGQDLEVLDKRKHFNAENEVVLYETIQAHTTQANWQPKDVPALFKRIGFDNEILDWVQPLGSEDAYNIDDEVKHNGFYWTSLVNANVWEPSDAVPTLWQKGDAV